MKLITIIGVTLLASACVQPARLVKSDAERVLTTVTLDAPNPGMKGGYGTAKFYYGSGTDKRRREFRDSVLIKTESVNGTPFLRGLAAKEARKRWKYWGFNEKALPLNGRVWYPVGEGPFPLILIVHGNHNMKEFSDPGYEYLGEHFASRGFITVSIDQNYINGAIRGENDARGWLLLKHLSAWKEMENDPAFPLKGKVDHDRIALIGHSRGGEAVAVASAFNNLAFYPDDARIKFDFGHSIRSVIAIAPVDGQYRPADRFPPVKGVNYFVIHGSHDADVSSFVGQRTYLRADVREQGLIKSALYVYRANHGQFNTVWGDNDVGPAGWLLNRKSLVSGEEQRNIGRVFFTGFLELTLNARHEYEPMFRDYRSVGGWLPPTMYVSQFSSGNELIVADFEEDIDVTTGSLPGVTIAGEGLAAWNEAALRSRGGGGGALFETNTAVVGWKRGADSLAPAYTIHLTDSLAQQLSRSENGALIFSLADIGRSPSHLNPADTLSPEGLKEFEQARKDSADSQSGARKPAVSQKPKSRAELPADSLRVDLSVELVSADGRVASVPVSAVAALRPPLTVTLYKHRYVETRISPVGRDHEYVLQRIEIPLSRFAADHPWVLSGAGIRAIRFRFDKTASGTVLIDDVGFDFR